MALTQRPDVRRRLYDRDQGMCHICGHPVAFDAMHLDHVVPAAWHGPTTEDNLRVAHPYCNQAKGTTYQGKRPRRSKSYVDVDIAGFVLRLPPDLHEKLKALAEREDRSIHAQILHILRKALAE